jgi:ubiquinone/menaquinone biosynthesis C-methylase UbiE
MKVADFGIGAGFFTRAAARAVGPRGVVYAIDVDRALLKYVESLAVAEQLHNIEYIQGDFEEPHASSLPDGSVDVVLVANTLFQVQDKQSLVSEAFRILRKGGRAVVIDWQDSFNNMGPHKDHVVNRDAALTLFTHGGGFTHMEDIPAGSFHYGLILKKN